MNEIVVMLKLTSFTGNKTFYFYAQDFSVLFSSDLKTRPRTASFIYFFHKHYPLLNTLFMLKMNSNENVNNATLKQIELLKDEL